VNNILPGIALLISTVTAGIAVWQWIKYKNLWFWASREVGRLNLNVWVYRDTIRDQKATIRDQKATIRDQKATIDELREG